MSSAALAETTVKVKVETWQRLNAMKRPGDSMDAVIARLLAERESAERTPK